MAIRQILRFLFFVTCFGGCLYHVHYVSNQYFSYKTRTRVNSKLQDIVNYPTIIFCAQLKDIINPLALSKSFLSNLHNLTIHQLFHLTPLENETIDRCRFRDDSQHKYIFKDNNSSQCRHHFGVKKLIIGNLICYQIYTIKSLKYSIYRIANAFDWTTVVYNIQLSKAFINSTDIFMPAFYLPTSKNNMKNRQVYPNNSKKFGEVIIRTNNDNWIIMRPYAEDYQLLPAPYDTNCTYMSGCYQNCIIEKTESKLSLFPFSEPANETYSQLQLLSSNHIKHSSTLQQWKQIQFSCQQKCSQLECTMSLTSNMAYTYPFYKPTNLTLTVSVPGTYFKTISSIPALSLIEYISAMTTCISIWFGFSALSANPFKWAQRKVFRKYRQHFNRLNFGRWVYLIICFIGFTYQLSSVCDQFFKFETSSRIEVSSEDEYKYQTLGTCFIHHDILNRNNSHQYNISQTVEQAWVNGDEIFYLTVDQLFKLSPKTENIIKGCSIRNEFNFKLNTLNVQECTLWFTVKKVLRGEHMCYFFIPPDNETFSWTRVATSFTGKGRVYEVVLDQRAVTNTMLAVISHQGTPGKWLPRLSRNFAQLINIERRLL